MSNPAPVPAHLRSGEPKAAADAEAIATHTPYADGAAAQ